MLTKCCLLKITRSNFFNLKDRNQNKVNKRVFVLAKRGFTLILFFVLSVEWIVELKIKLSVFSTNEHVSKNKMLMKVLEHQKSVKNQFEYIHKLKNTQSLKGPAPDLIYRTNSILAPILWKTQNLKSDSNLRRSLIHKVSRKSRVDRLS